MSADGYTEKLRERYSGKGATLYEKNRSNDVRWQAEQAWFGARIADKAGKQFLDLPVGTGRFMKELAAANAKLVAGDISADMLTVAGEAADAAGLKDVRYIEADITAGELPDDVEVDVSISARFFNWLSNPLARTAFLNIAKVTREEMLITLTTIDEREFEGTRRKQVERRLANTHVPKPDAKLPPNGPHSYLSFLDWLEEAGFEIADKVQLSAGQSGLEVNMYRLTRI